MAHQWDEVIAELVQLVPELEPVCRPDVSTALDDSLRFLGENATQEDVDYLLELQTAHPETIRGSA